MVYMDVLVHTCTTNHSKADLTDSESSSADDDDDDDVMVQGNPHHANPTYQEEQEELKKDFKRALSEDDEDEQVLTLRVKTKKEKVQVQCVSIVEYNRSILFVHSLQEQEEKEYSDWLKANEGNKDLDSLRSFWADPCLEEGEQFLRDYILGQGHRDDSNITVPTYEEVVGSDGEGETEEGSDSEDEEALEEQEDFERKFNFRFEEPEGDLVSCIIVTHLCTFVVDRLSTHVCTAQVIT